MKNRLTIGAVSLRALVACASLIAAAAAMANDGFYQGAGSTLVPVKNSHLRVRAEKLLISPSAPGACYPVYVGGKLVRDGMRVKSATKATVGPRTKCDHVGYFTQLYASWHAVADYEVEALESQEDVLIGFPVSWWLREFDDANGDLDGVDAPGVADFHSYVNGEEIQRLTLRKLQGNAPDGRKIYELGYTWRASFQAEKPYHLRTEYDFGEDTSNAFYPGREFVEGETPRFLGTTLDTAAAGANRLIYFLTPINSWAAPPPDRIDIEVRVGVGIPITYFVPTQFKPVCVSTSAFHYLLTSKGPSQELGLSYAQGTKFKPLTTVSQWKAWRKTLGGSSVRISCDLIAELKKAATPGLLSHLESYQCISSCGE